MILDWEKFIEAQLSVPDLKKPSDPKVTNFGPLRGDVLLGKIRRGDELEIKGGERVKVEIEGGVDIQTPEGNFDPDKADNLKISKSRLKPVFIDKSDPETKFKLSDFVKTKEFSGGGGSSLGTTGTKIMESLQTYVLSLKQNFYPEKFLHQNYLTLTRNLERMSKSRDAFTPIQFSEEDLSTYKKYHLTFIKTANKFIGLNGILGPNRRYNFHQVSSDSDFMKQLRSTYRRCCTESFGKVINMAKWTPSDIWAVSKRSEGEIIESLSKIVRMDELNNFVDERFGSGQEDRDMVGISLKKIATRKENVTVIINKETERPRFFFKGISISPDPFTKGLEIELERVSKKYPGRDILTIRSTESKITNIVAEISGSTSRHGKCSFTQINDILEDNGLSKIPTTGEFDILTEEELESKILELDRKIKGDETTRKKLDTLKVRSPNKASLISKLQSLHFANIILEAKISGDNDCDNVLNSIMYYALAISNRYFECPKYARVVEF